MHSMGHPTVESPRYRRARVCMPSSTWPALALSAVVLVAGCGTGDASITLISLGGSMVIKSDSGAIAAIRATVIAGSGTQHIGNGSDAVGAHVCGFKVSKNGHEYQVDYYGQLPSDLCSSASQANFLSTAP
jgi:hypothetical protein